MVNRVLLPTEVDIDKCISLDAHFQDARLDLNKLTRFTSSCNRVEGDVVADVSFEIDLNGFRTIKISVQADVVLTCQRCFKEYVQPIDVEIVVTPDFDKAKACNLQNKYEFVELKDNDKIDLYELIEDELILEFPSYPRHEDEEECNLKGSDWSYGEIKVEEKDNPFAALAQLKADLQDKK